MSAGRKLRAERSPTRGLAAAKLSVMACALLAAAACGETAPEATSEKKVDDVIVACEAPSLALPDGSCIRPGVPPDGCSEGFEHDGEYGCDPILPAEACGPGMMAVPGETACRPVMPCGQGRWGDLPVDATTEYVDASYSGGGSDGTSDKPWTRVQDAYAAAAPGALVAIAEGRYREDLSLLYKPVRLWGLCPEKVSIEGVGAAAAIMIGPGASGSELGGLAVTSPGFGIAISGAKDLSLDRLWIHHTTEPALAAVPDIGRSSLTVRGCLIDNAQSVGIFVSDADFTFTESVVRGTAARAIDQRFGSGIRAQMTCSSMGCDTTSRPIVVLERSLFDGNHTDGVSVMGTDLTMTGSVVRNTLPQPADQKSGIGVGLGLACTSGNARCFGEEPSRATIVGSFIAHNHDSGIYGVGSELTVDNTVVRGTLPEANDQRRGVGVMLETGCLLLGCDRGIPSRGSVRTSLVEENHAAAIMLRGSTATIEYSVARHTLPQAADLGMGIGIGAKAKCDAMNHCDTTQGADLTVLGCLAEDNHYAGVIALYSDASIQSSVIRRTLPRQSDDKFGDGLVVSFLTGESVSSVDNVRIEDSARAGIANLGTEMALSGNTITCAAFELVGQDVNKWPHQFEDLGGNRCGCPEASHACKSISAGLEPPQLEPPQLEP